MISFELYLFSLTIFLYFVVISYYKNKNILKILCKDSKITKQIIKWEYSLIDNYINALLKIPPWFLTNILFARYRYEFIYKNRIIIKERL